MPVALSLRHYDAARDYQTGVQRVVRPGAGRQEQGIDLPEAMSADRARAYCRTAECGVERAGADGPALRLGCAGVERWRRGACGPGAGALADRGARMGSDGGATRSTAGAGGGWDAACGGFAGGDRAAGGCAAWADQPDAGRPAAAARRGCERAVDRRGGERRAGLAQCGIVRDGGERRSGAGGTQRGTRGDGQGRNPTGTGQCDVGGPAGDTGRDAAGRRHDAGPRRRGDVGTGAEPVPGGARTDPVRGGGEDGRAPVAAYGLAARAARHRMGGGAITGPGSLSC